MQIRVGGGSFLGNLGGRGFWQSGKSSQKGGSKMLAIRRGVCIFSGITQCHDDKQERHLFTQKRNIAKQKRYISQSGNNISQSWNDLSQSGNEILLPGSDILQSDTISRREIKQ